MEVQDGDDAPDGYGESSRYAAHLDRGWSLLDRNEIDAARTSAEQARELRPDSPDAPVLLGAIALAIGDAEESLRWYDTAVELDPEYFEPYAAAAQVCLFDLGDPARALRYCEEADSLEHLHPLETLDLQLIGAEAEMAMGEYQRARQRMEALDEAEMVRRVLARPESQRADGEGEDGPLVSFLLYEDDGEPLADDERRERLQRLEGFSFRIARLWLDLKDPDHALAVLRAVVTRFPDDADGWYMLAEAENLAGNPRAACQAALRTHRLDAQTRAPSWAPAPQELHRRVVQLLQRARDPLLVELTEAAGALMVLVHDAPSLELVLEGVDPRIPALALAARATRTDGGEPDEPALLSGLAIYRRNLLRVAGTLEQFDEELRFALLDELAAFFRLDDDRRAALGLGPMQPAEIPAPEPTPSTSDDGEAKKPARTRARRKRKRVDN